MTVGEALDAFDAGWVEMQAITPQTAYRRTIRLLRLYLRDHAPALDDPVTALAPETLTGFVLWHRSHALADTAEGSRKVAVHVARLGAYLAGEFGLGDLELDRDGLRALVPDDAA